MVISDFKARLCGFTLIDVLINLKAELTIFTNLNVTDVLFDELDC